MQSILFFIPWENSTVKGLSTNSMHKNTEIFILNGNVRCRELSHLLQNSQGDTECSVYLEDKKEH